MLVKFFKGGTSKGGPIVDYLTRATDSKGIARDPRPEILKGDPEAIARIIDSLDFKYKFQTGVISFAPEDAPTPEQQRAVMESFEATAFAGLDADRHDILWVRHSHTGNGRVELHFLTPRVELETRHSLNIAPPGHANYFCHWRDYWNYKEGWARPDDPDRARTHHHDYHALIEAQNQRLREAGLATENRENTRQIITDFVIENVKLGRIGNRDDLIATLQEVGFEITRAGENYISVTRHDLNRAIRLKGGIYEASWRPQQTATGEVGERAPTDRGDPSARVRQAEAELRARVSGRREYHQKRYGLPATASARTIEVVSSSTGGQPRESLRDFLSRQLGDDAILARPDTGDRPEPSLALDAGEDLRSSGKTESGSPILRERAGDVSHSPVRNEVQNRLEMRRSTLPETTGLNHDRPRARTHRDLEKLHQTIRGGQATASRTYREIDEATTREREATTREQETAGRIVRQTDEICQGIERDRQRVRERLQRHPERFRRIKIKQDEELERFKTEINLVDYALGQGYEIDPRKTGRHCIVLTSGEDKILVGIDRSDGHYFYSSVRDDRDKGSIVDFIQKRRPLNLGEVRKELRPWLNGQISSSPPIAVQFRKPLPTTKDRHKIIGQYERMTPISSHPYLDRRGINRATAESDRFRGTIHADASDNVIFAHRDREGICGYEIRNAGFKGFSEGGTKGLWHSITYPDDAKLVICESPIDCLSYYRLHDDGRTRYVAISGNLSETQEELLRDELKRIHQQGGEIFIATDNDPAGEKLAVRIAELAPKDGRVFRHTLEHQKDWNEALKARLAENARQSERRGRERGGFSL